MIIKITPIPAHFVYDGFEKDLYAGLVYEPILKHSATKYDMFTHLKSFLVACFSTKNAGDEIPYVLGTVFKAPASIDARQWARDKFKTCFQDPKGPHPSLPPL